MTESLQALAAQVQNMPTITFQSITPLLFQTTIERNLDNAASIMLWKNIPQPVCQSSKNLYDCVDLLQRFVLTLEARFNSLTVAVQAKTDAFDSKLFQIKKDLDNDQRSFDFQQKDRLNTVNNQINDAMVQRELLQYQKLSAEIEQRCENTTGNVKIWAGNAINEKIRACESRQQVVIKKSCQNVQDQFNVPMYIGQKGCHYDSFAHFVERNYQMSEIMEKKIISHLELIMENKTQLTSHFNNQTRISESVTILADKLTLAGNEFETSLKATSKKLTQLFDSKFADVKSTQELSVGELEKSLQDHNERLESLAMHSDGVDDLLQKLQRDCIQLLVRDYQQAEVSQKLSEQGSPTASLAKQSSFNMQAMFKPKIKEMVKSELEKAFTTKTTDAKNSLVIPDLTIVPRENNQEAHQNDYRKPNEKKKKNKKATRTETSSQIKGAATDTQVVYQSVQNQPLETVEAKLEEPIVNRTVTKYSDESSEHDERWRPQVNQWKSMPPDYVELLKRISNLEKLVSKEQSGNVAVKLRHQSKEVVNKRTSIDRKLRSGNASLQEALQARSSKSRHSPETIRNFQVKPLQWDPQNRNWVTRNQQNQGSNALLKTKFKEMQKSHVPEQLKYLNDYQSLQGSVQVNAHSVKQIPRYEVADPEVKHKIISSRIHCKTEQAVRPQSGQLPGHSSVTVLKHHIAHCQDI